VRPLAEAISGLDLAPWCPHFCFWLFRIVCHRICIRVCPPPTPLRLFRRIGAIVYATHVDSGPAGSGLTLADSRAFYSVLRLNGVLHPQLSGQPAEYPFEVPPACSRPTAT